MAAQEVPGGESWLNPLREGERGPDAKGMHPWVLLVAGPIWDIAHGRSHPLWAACTAALLVPALYLVTVRLAFTDHRGPGASGCPCSPSPSSQAPPRTATTGSTCWSCWRSRSG
ncbi:hypothetical protein ACQP1V_23305 [Microtetraspora malaysiensis]|uniref:hypothetical protein n=1 Tax=Microtetraspora malaysiensis TaxID=161358 RepID=UPI003D90132D